MDESTFFQKCKALAGDTSDTSWTADEMAGFFQRFRPGGHGLERLFADIPGGLDVFGRLKRVFDATTMLPNDPRRTDLYFVVRCPNRASNKRLLGLAADQFANWRRMAAEFNAQELIELLTPIPQIRISNGPQPSVNTNDFNALDVFIYDVQTDWHGCLPPLCPQARWMREAFYTIACDYYLARYITWPWYMNSSRIREPFEPYFDLWLCGATLQCPSPDSVTLYVPSYSQQQREQDINARLATGELMVGLFLKQDAWDHDGSSAIEPVARTWFPLDKTESVIGRERSVDITLPCRYISRAQVKVVREGDAYFLEDISSANGTVFKGKSLRLQDRQRLHDGDEIRVGDYLFVFINRYGAALA